MSLSICNLWWLMMICSTRLFHTPIQTFKRKCIVTSTGQFVARLSPIYKPHSCLLRRPYMQHITLRANNLLGGFLVYSAKKQSGPWGCAGVNLFHRDATRCHLSLLASNTRLLPAKIALATAIVRRANFAEDWIGKPPLLILGNTTGF